MRVSQQVQCITFPCSGVNHACYMIPKVNVKPDAVTIILVSEAAPQDPNDYYYARGKPLFEETTVLAFQDAGADVSSIRDILGLGVYLTTALKCGKSGYGVSAVSIKQCSLLLEKELGLFPNARALLLMGDVAIKAVNYIAQRAGQGRVIPSGSTYRLRDKEYSFSGKRVFPSYLQAGPSFFIEKLKRKMIAEDIAAALQVAHES